MRIKISLFFCFFFFVVTLSHCLASERVPDDFAGVVWLHADVSSWEQSGVLKNVSVGGSMIVLDYDKAYVWPERDGLNGNPWIFVKKDGVWYAATWEWLRFGQTAKFVRAVNGDHIKKDPLKNFSPVNGEIYGFMVSGFARTSSRNVEERTNVVMYKWGSGVIPDEPDVPDQQILAPIHNLLLKDGTN